MTDDHVAPDPLVRAALQLLPVPPHEDGFWLALGAGMDAAPARAATGGHRLHPLTATVIATADTDTTDSAAGVSASPAAEPREALLPGRAIEPAPVDLVPDTTLALVPPGLRRRSNAVLSAVAVAAAVLVVVAGTTLVRQRGGGPTDVATLVGVDADAAASSSTTPVVVSDPSDPASPTGAVLRWVAALGAGDIDAAWAAMAQGSRAHFGSKATFAEERTGLAEGYGAWSAAPPDAMVVTPVSASGDGQLVVVTLVGTIDQEGQRQHRADAFPVRIVDGQASVEPFAVAGELDFLVPEDVPADGTRPLVGRDDELAVVVPRGVVAPIIRLDDGDTLVCGDAEGTELTELTDAPGQRCSYHPEGGIEAGDRVLTVAFVSADGAGISAASVVFEAA